ncbi:MAG TPA: hypothetical protein VFR09_05370, partial [Alphaproteobacteria bacterium]|nr:hypothetical protein [Alphaproteobacteria bacterium]
AYLTVPFGWDGWFIDGAGAGIGVTIKIAQQVASWPYSIVYLPAMPAFALIGIVMGGLWLCLWKKRWRYLGLVPIVCAALYPLYTPQPDFMVSADGKEWAARLDDGKLAVSNLDHDKFTTEQWQQRLGNIPMLDVDELPPTEKQVQCDDAGCIYHHGDKVIAMPQVESAALEDCERADLVVAPFTISDECSAEAIDDPELWHHGAHTVRFDKGAMEIKYARNKRGLRPWSAGWKNPE